MEEWTVKRLLEWSIAYFKRNDVPNPRLSSEMLLADVLDFKRIDLYLNYSKMLNSQELSRYREHVKKRSEHQPVQYILDRAYFRDLDLYVDKNVLIPRPETEFLVDKVIEIYQKISGIKDSINILEIGTGSGAIAISLARELKGSPNIIATEKYEEAYEIALSNASKNLTEKLLKRIDFYIADLVPGKKDFLKNYRENIEIIVSNPPYIPEGDIKSLPREVRDYEPIHALNGGRDGTDFYARILGLSKGLLAAGNAHVVFETDPPRYLKVIETAQKVYDSPEIEILKDYSGKERVVDIRPRQWSSQ